MNSLSRTSISFIYSLNFFLIRKYFSHRIGPSMFLLFLGTILGSMLNKLLIPRHEDIFIEEVTPEDQQMVLSLTNLTKDPHLRFKITTPSGPADSNEDSEILEGSLDSFGESLKSNFTKYYTATGKYQIILHNSGDTGIEYQVSSYVYKKVNDSNKDVQELRNLLNSLQSTMDTLGNENYYLRMRQNRSIEEAKFIRRAMSWLILFPLCTMLVGYAKYVFAKQMVKPKGKRFKGLF